MRELIPVPQGSMNDLLLNVGPRNVAFNVSNGYYGYQSHAHFPDRDRSNNNQAPVKMEVQQVNSQEHVQIEIQNAFWRDLDPYLNRKRQRDVAEDLGTAKRRKESSSVNCLPSLDNGKGLLEDMLWTTHGVSVYQWTNSSV